MPPSSPPLRSSRPLTRTVRWLALMLLVLASTAVVHAAPPLPELTLTQGRDSQQLTLAQIEQTGLHHVEMHHPEGPEGRFSGVWLDDFLAANGLDEARRVRFIADDGYTTFLTPAQRQEKAYLLVTRLEGQPIARDRLGPLMLVVPEDTEAVWEGTAPMARWIWAIQEIRG